MASSFKWKQKTRMMNDGLVALMNRADAPNLYFALCEFPNRREIYNHSHYRNREFLVLNIPDLAKVFAGEELNAQQWHDLLATATRFNEQWKVNPMMADPNPKKTLAAAQAAYAERHHLSADQTQSVDSSTLLGEFYALTAQRMSDDRFKWRGLPYPMAMVKEHEAFSKMYQPGNPFLDLFDMSKETSKFARVDRQMAALTNIEAIRSYAAANGGKLPASLDEITETPALPDPATGKQFDYRAENNLAVLSSSALDGPLKYTIRIRR